MFVPSSRCPPRNKKKLEHTCCNVSAFQVCIDENRHLKMIDHIIIENLLLKIAKNVQNCQDVTVSKVIFYLSLKNYSPFGKPNSTAVKFEII